MQVRRHWVQVPGPWCAPEAAPAAPAGTEIMHGNVNTEPKFATSPWGTAPQTPPSVNSQVTSAVEQIR